MLDDENSGGDTGGPVVDQERRIRREIANSNERRRMQSINAGFQSLRTLLPHHEGEKLSKAAILQQTAEYIYTLEQEKTRLLQQNSQLKRLLALSQQRLEGDDTSPQLKKKRIVAEGETNIRGSDEDVFVSGQVSDLNLQLIAEQRLRVGLEERLRSMEAQLHGGGVGGGVTTTTVTAASLPGGGQTIINRVPDEETCRIVVTQDLSSRPPTAILLANVPEPLALAAAEESPAVRDAVEMLPSLTAPPPPSPQTTTVVVTSQPPPEISIPLSTATVIERTLPQELTESNMSGRSFILTTSSRQNLDSIVEAIRHLEGDHLFSEDQQVVKEEIVEYTTTTTSSNLSTIHSNISSTAAKLSINPSAFIAEHPNNSSSSIFIINKN